MKHLIETQLVDALLLEWYDWSAEYRPALGADRASATCREAPSSRQYQSSTEASCSGLHISEMQSVEFCVDQLPTPQRLAIELEMRNRRTRAKVWRNSNADTYENAVAAVRPIMRRRGLFDGK
jgi:hypothetical protein